MQRMGSSASNQGRCTETIGKLFYTFLLTQKGESRLLLGTVQARIVGLERSVSYSAHATKLIPKEQQICGASAMKRNVRLLPEYLDAQKEEFKGKQVDLFRSGVFFSVCFSLLAGKVFNIKPKAAMGLSMGEVSMLCILSAQFKAKRRQFLA